jgi:hypothetical protein
MKEYVMPERFFVYATVFVLFLFSFLFLFGKVFLQQPDTWYGFMILFLLLLLPTMVIVINTAYRVLINENELILYTPLRKHIIPWNRISKISFTNNSFGKISEILIFIGRRKIFPNLKIDGKIKNSYELYNDILTHCAHLPINLKPKPKNFRISSPL